MAFTLANWARSSVSANEPLVTLTSGTVVGSTSSYEYWTLDTQATVANTANYFCPTASNSVVNDLSVGDTIRVYSATDLTSVTYLVTVVTPATPAITIVALTGQLVANVTISNAQMLAGIYAFPVQIAPPPGANRVIVVENATISIVYGSVQFQNGGAVRLQYDSTVHAGGTNAMATTVAAADINAATANNFQLLLGVAQAWGLNTALGNKGIYISCATGEFTAGDSALKVSMLYRVATLI